MKTFRFTWALIALASVLGGTPALSQADSARMAQYEMWGSSTDLWDHDVEYFAPPIRLIRKKKTFDIHALDFNARRYFQECVSWQQVCVRYDQYGKCVAWETRCVQWDYRAYPLPRRIELTFHKLPDLAEDEEEIYEIHISRQRPIGAGDDWVTTWLSEVKTKVPVRITKLGDFKYTVDPK